MRLALLALAALASAGLCACSSTGDGRSGLAESLDLDNYRRANDTNGTQSRRDVNRAYTAPTLPTIGNRGL